MKRKQQPHQSATFFDGDLQVLELQTVEPTLAMMMRPRKGRPVNQLAASAIVRAKKKAPKKKK